MDIETIAQLPIIFAVKSAAANYLAITNELAVIMGYKDADDFLINGRRDENIRGAVCEIADIFTAEDQTVIQTKTNLNALSWGYYEHRFMLVAVQKKLLNFNNQQAVGYHAYDISTNNRLYHSLLDCIDDKSQSGSIKLQSSYETYGLSHKQSQCAYYLVRGYSARDISEKLSISKRTVESYINVIKIKMHCQNKKQIVEKLVSDGYADTFITSLVQAVNMKVK